MILLVLKLVFGNRLMRHSHKLVISTGQVASVFLQARGFQTWIYMKSLKHLLKWEVPKSNPKKVWSSWPRHLQRGHKIVKQSMPFWAGLPRTQGHISTELIIAATWKKGKLCLPGRKWTVLKTGEEESNISQKW